MTTAVLSVNLKYQCLHSTVIADEGQIKDVYYQKCTIILVDHEFWKTDKLSNVIHFCINVFFINFVLQNAIIQTLMKHMRGLPWHFSQCLKRENWDSEVQEAAVYFTQYTK